MHPLDTLMREEFDKIVSSEQFLIKYDIRCVIHAPNEDIDALFVMDFSLLRDYMNNFSDVLSITAVFGAGTVTHRIMPYGKELQATVTLRPLANVPDYVKSQAGSINEFRYKAVLWDNAVSAIESNLQSDTNKNQRDIEDIQAVKIQLVNPLQEQLRAKTFGGMIRNANPMSAIRALLTKFSKLTTIEAQDKVVGVDVTPGYSLEVREHILVPHLTPVIRLPMVINDVVGGLYPTGFQYYLQKNLWYIFSPFNVKAFEKSEYTLTVVNVTKDKLAQVEKTFRITPTQIIVLCTGEVKFTRMSDRAEVNASSGTRFVDAKNILKGYGSTGDNKLRIVRKDNINEFESQSSQSVSMVKESESRITTNYMNEYSKIAYKKGAMLQFTWSNSVDNLIIPGMPVRFMYMDGTMPKQVYGNVVALESAYVSEIKSVTQKKFTNTTIVSCFVEDVIKNSEML